MLSKFVEKSVIFYGAGPFLAKNIKRLRNQGYIPVCACDIDKTKQYKSFCGRSDIIVLPLDRALAQYPECRIYVTVDYSALGEVLHYLTTEKGILPERIINYVPVEQRLGCIELETSIKFRTKRIFVRCYWRHPGIDRGSDLVEDIRKFNEWKDSAIEAVRLNQPSPCDGCNNLKLGWYPVKRQLTSLQVSDSNEHSYCNFNCVYCFVHAKNKRPVEVTMEEDEQLEVLRYVSDNLPNQTLELQFSTGELTVHPHPDEILKLFESYQTTLFTNAGIYNEKIADLMESGLLSIVVSMDSGTRETFYQIKDVDCFDQVCENLIRYAATGGCIVLKYIMLSGINDKFIDTDGFIDLAVQLGAVVQLSNDTRTRCAPLMERSRKAVCRLAEQARNNNLLVIHEQEVFSAEDNRAITEVLKGNGGTA